jgi:hypothetical protein
MATFAAALPRLAGCPTRSSAETARISHVQVEFLMGRSGGKDQVEGKDKD